MIMDELQHPLALRLQEPIVVGGAVVAIIRHQLVLESVRSESHLATPQDLLIEIINTFQLHQQL